MVANLPAPSGLEDRIHASLRSAPRPARVLAWPARLKPESNWMRSAAAAAIVFVVAGGGWGVYTRVEQSRPGKVIAMPLHAAPGGFSGAGAVRTPTTIPGPAAPRATQMKDEKKPAAKAADRAADKAADKAATKGGVSSQIAGQK